MNDKKIILLGGLGQSTNIVFNALDEDIGITLAIIEKKEPLKKFLTRRIKRLGLFTVTGQILFQTIVVKLLNKASKKRKADIINHHQLNISEIPAEKVKYVNSVNAQSTIDLINEVNPHLIIVNGTRIISKKVLQATGCKFINTHVGITPRYRGVHGMYWALVNNDLKNSGVTIHFVDEGIDTGSVIEQAVVLPMAKDNFTTYPLLQLSAGISLLKKAIKDHFDDKVVLTNSTGKSKLYYHPTIWEYLYYRATRKVK